MSDEQETEVRALFEKLMRQSFARFLDDIEGAVKDDPGIEELEVIAAICECVPEATAHDAKRLIDFLVETKKVTREGRYLLPKHIEM